MTYGHGVKRVKRQTLKSMGTVNHVTDYLTSNLTNTIYINKAETWISKVKKCEEQPGRQIRKRTRTGIKNKGSRYEVAAYRMKILEKEQEHDNS